MTAYIATLKSKEFIRHILAQKRNRNKEVPVEDASHIFAPDVVLLASIATDEVLCALDPVDRALLEGKALEGLDSRELAERHGLNRSSVRTRIKRSIDLLKRRVKAQGLTELRIISLLIGFFAAGWTLSELRAT
jgi:DNA-directed RNA polymerase specialized sigma24 family protein